jgi:diphthine synthase
MVLYVIGLGLGNEKDITIRGYECAKRCKLLYLEYYTSILGVNTETLSSFYGVSVLIADRNMVSSTLFRKEKQNNTIF